MKRNNDTKFSDKVRELPFIGPLFVITNAFVFNGKIEHFGEIAPPKRWKARLGAGLFSSALMSLVMLAVVHFAGIDIAKFTPESILLSLFPNLLGFGIGVFALIFALPNDFLLTLIQASEESGDEELAPEMLPVDMAYPLVVYCISIIVTIICSAFPDSWVSTGVILAMLFYGLYVTLGLLLTIFSTASYMLTIRRIEEIKKRG